MRTVLTLLRLLAYLRRALPGALVRFFQRVGARALRWLSRRRLGRLAAERPGCDATFDYVVGGGGTAGIVVAVRLAEAGHSVALVEAGHHYEVFDPLLASIPGADVLLVGADVANGHPVVDWNIVVEAQPGGAPLSRPIRYARGKCLGGTSALNFMIYQRPTIQSCRQWADAVGDESYTFDEVLPYYQKSVTFTPPHATKRPEIHAPRYNPKAFSQTTTDGPLHVSYTNYAQPFSTWLGAAFTEIGVPETTDFNSGRLMGHQYCTSTIRPSDQSRCTSESSFLQLALAKKLWNLKVYTGTAMNKVLFDKKKTATGVEVRTGDKWYRLHARNEVVLCGGAFHSPQMLMLSGIGPRATLDEFGIDVVVDAPGVGQNLWDHPTFGPTYPVKVETVTKLARQPWHFLKKALEYFVSATGPLANPVSDWLAWEKIPGDLRAEFSPETREKLAQFPDDWPEVEYISGAGYVGDFSNLVVNQPWDGRDYGTILTVLIAPLSRGSVTLRSRSPTDLPVVRPNWLADPADQEVAVAAYKRARQAFRTQAMAPVLDGDEAYPGEDKVQTDAQILEAIRASMTTLWHPAGTCKMGRPDQGDPMAVLDARARVRGVVGLRVVDASSFPFLPPGHPQSTVYMLAEKIADDMIHGDRMQAGAYRGRIFPLRRSGSKESRLSRQSRESNLGSKESKQ